MESLPLEIMTEILLHLPPCTMKDARLTCRTFNEILAKPTFRVLADFTDLDYAQRTLEDIVSDFSRRPRSVWSPSCSVPPKLPVTESFLLALDTALHGAKPARPGPQDPKLEMQGSRATRLDIQSPDGTFKDDEVTKQYLRRVMFRYALYLSYAYDRGEDAPQAWVFKAGLRGEKAKAAV
ncbi:hypothetical protein B0I35DRAFT_123556 [Stachybotrys elegans]|uniref:F-box domain-containing protein n=1 Tax=Stachybotrys elegans TaxID=80388 RepID=A0A8K0WUU8_9HYPO|nr:hypothetical protein B0I35DRAFT_123556 [Stachybotrys elegans]